MKQAIIITSIEEASEWMLDKNFEKTEIDYKVFNDFGYINKDKDTEIVILYQVKKN